MIYLIIALAIAQAYTFYSLKRIKKGNITSNKPNRSISTEEELLRTLSYKIKYSDIEPEYQTIYNILETIKLEDWQFEIKDSTIDNYLLEYTFKFSSNNNDSYVSGIIRKYGESSNLDSSFKIGFLIFNIKGSSLTLDDEYKTKPLHNDLVSFVSYYLIKYYQKENKESLDAFKNKLTMINRGLKTLNRSKKLDDILGNDC